MSKASEWAKHKAEVDANRPAQFFHRADTGQLAAFVRDDGGLQFSADWDPPPHIWCEFARWILDTFGEEPA